MSSKKRRALLICHSRTGNSLRLCEKTAEILREGGVEAKIIRIRPAFGIPYPGWLFLSLFPTMKFPIKQIGEDMRGFDLALLFLPKWTMANPVVNKFISRATFKFPPTGVIVSYGGWRGESFLHSVKASLWMRGIKVLGGILVKRSEKDQEEGKIREFLGSVLPDAFPKRP
ncbi:hypothetical protein FDZ71_02805 [bacterium]|nr:MAG: hypothetical protein FDZ71_02805 [bacterium]